MVRYVKSFGIRIHKDITRRKVGFYCKRLTLVADSCEKLSTDAKSGSAERRAFLDSRERADELTQRFNAQASNASLLLCFIWGFQLFCSPTFGSGHNREPNDCITVYKYHIR